MSLPVPGPGRDSLYDPSMNDMARKLALLGLTDAEMAEFFGISVRTFHRWKEEFPAFCHSLNEGKTVADANVADSLYRRAVGEVVFVEKRVKNADGECEIIRLSQQIPADPGAAKLWLTNRRGQNWRESKDVNLSGSVELTSKEQRDAAVAAALRANS